MSEKKNKRKIFSDVSKFKNDNNKIKLIDPNVQKSINKIIFKRKANFKLSEKNNFKNIEILLNSFQSISIDKGKSSITPRQLVKNLENLFKI